MEGISASFDDQKDANASAFIKNQEHGCKKLSDEIAAKLQRLKSFPESTGYCCIYKVSDPIRQSNEAAYTPQVISIGPFHRGNPKLRTMEEFKLRYLQSFKDKAQINLEDLVSTVKSSEESIRACYSESIPLCSDEFVAMILVDASFIIELFRKRWSNTWEEYDHRTLTSWLTRRVHLDLILLENQLPFFIIEKLYDTAYPSLSNDHSFIELCFSTFEYYNVQEFKHSDVQFKWENILHFTDLLRKFFLPPRGKQFPERNPYIIREMPSATQLAKVGLKFEKIYSSNHRSPLELKYAKGVLEIPWFQLDNTAEIFARNLMALEECHYPKLAYITDYYILLSFLITTVEDVDLLERNQIISNRLDGVAATSMINKLSQKSISSEMNPDYHQIAQELNEFYAYQSKRTWIRDLFRTPLIRFSAISAVLYLFFTFVQTVCSFLSLKDSFSFSSNYLKLV